MAALICLTTFGVSENALWAAEPALPAAYEVQQVQGDDVLNIRAKPSAKAEVVGEIAPFSTHVEILALSDDRRWGRVGLSEGNGWVSMAYLVPSPSADPNRIPRPLSCHGTEPFWYIGLLEQGAEYNSPDTGRVELTLTEERVAAQGFLFRTEEGPTQQRTLIVNRQICSDGMSDREYGFSVRMFSDSPDGNGAYTGCCSFDHR